MLVGDVVDTTTIVAATRKRTEKRAALAALLTQASADEVTPLVGMLTGDPRQGALGTGWASVAAVDVEPNEGGTITVLQLDGALTALQGLHGPGSQGERGALLDELFSRASSSEQDFIGRLIIGELRQGALAGIVTDAVADAAAVPPKLMRRATMLSGNLGTASRLALTEGVEGLQEVELEPLRPVQPMLASTAESAGTAVAELGLSSVEWKLDGIRIQLHRSGDDVAVYTRNLNDVTARLPGVVELARNLPGNEFVLDGEILGCGHETDPEAFQDVMSSFGREAPDRQRLDLHPWFFDVLHLDGDDLIDEALTQRREALTGLVADLAIPGVITDDPHLAESTFADAVDAGHEGVMVKSADSLYEAGRRGKNWRKVKPVHTFDLVVLAAEWGHGRRQGWLSNLLLGARAADGSLVMVGKTFKGLTDQMLQWQTERLRELEVTTEGITVWVRPDLVVEVALDGVQRSTRYPGGIALRFARVKHHRPDKPASSIESLETLRALL
jgi:DNA ligase 1